MMVVSPTMGRAVNTTVKYTITAFFNKKPAPKRIIIHMATCRAMVNTTATLLPRIISAEVRGMDINISPVLRSFSPTMLSITRFPNKNRGKKSKMASITFRTICSGKDSPEVFSINPGELVLFWDFIDSR